MRRGRELQKTAAGVNGGTTAEATAAIVERGVRMIGVILRGATTDGDLNQAGTPAAPKDGVVTGAAPRAGAATGRGGAVRVGLTIARGDLIPTGLIPTEPTASRRMEIGVGAKLHIAEPLSGKSESLSGREPCMA